MENFLQDVAYPCPRDGKLMLPSTFKKKFMYEKYTEIGCRTLPIHLI